MRQAGFTLLELLLVVTILGIATMIAVPAYTRLMANQQAKAASTALYMAMVKARSEAIKRNVNITIGANASGWQGGWTLQDLTNNAGINIDAESALAGVTVSTNPSGLTSLIYQSSGRISAGTYPQIVFTSTNWSGAQYCVSADLGGRPYSTNGSTC
jgi:type IV fimbrial biogenesis protein FimT